MTAISSIKSSFGQFVAYCEAAPRMLSRVSSFVIQYLKNIISQERPRVVIIGSGPAGYTAALYAARANLVPIVYEGAFTKESMPGGQLMTTTVVENYPGFPNGVDGSALVASMRRQAIKFGATMLEEDVVNANLGHYPFVIQGQKTHTKASAVIIATGAKANRPDIPGTRDGELWQKGVSACAVCDGALPMFRDRHVLSLIHI